MIPKVNMRDHVILGLLIIFRLSNLDFGRDLKQPDYIVTITCALCVLRTLAVDLQKAEGFGV